MERTEPALVPEWLRCTGNIAGGGAALHVSDTSSPRSRAFRSNSEKESSHYLQRSSSSNSRRSSGSNGSAKHPYSSFSRSHWDRNRDREKEKSISEDFWEHGSSDPLVSILTSKVERNALRRSQSLVSRKTGEPSPQRVDNKDSPITGNGVLSRGSKLNVIQKSVFEKDFPSLGTEDKQGVAGIRRVSSPGLSSAVQSLPMGSSGFLGGEKWTSALAEVPAAVANNGTCHSPVQQNVSTFPNSSSGVSSTAGLNMAEALSQPPARVHTNPQLPDKSQRLEDLAIKQSRQLIPVTPSMPKPLVPGTADKSKQLKIALRTNDMTLAPKAVHAQPNSSHSANQSRAGQTRSDSVINPHVGKFLVLKPGRDSIVVGQKDVNSAPGNGNGKGTKDGQLAMGSCTATASNSVSNARVSVLENKSAALSQGSRSPVDKKSPQSLAQSRSEFFNLMRRKTSVRAPAIQSDSSSDILSPTAETTVENCKEGHASDTPCVLENGNQMVCNGDRYDITEKTGCLPDVEDSSLSYHGSIYPDAEEAAFLRSLGWEENGEDEGLTEEEINAFYDEYMKQRPSMEACQSSQPKQATPSKLPNAISDAISDSSSSESEPEA
ncbi:hypothetical protein SASPL_150169 [Salvia splendens]|uniref:Uncharacterized protein n=1 Tax=Salvia splendens TaxID=180675 RepID=A0A8X8Z1I3_SALSN|nr:uncharacterized protein LOC121782576 [Salvia splendens]XP_042036405.1 uncharacterized protein LOC121782576 [Salvia splendens]KAG6388737.1 hypothetical protein SASPL_150169 [Salvia splendens]